MEECAILLLYTFPPAVALGEKVDDVPKLLEVLEHWKA